MRRAVAMLLAVVGGVMVSSCASDDTGVSASRSAIATVPEQTTTTNPYAVPDVIDAAYVNRVLAGLDAAMGDVVRMAMKDGISREALERVKAIYSGPPLESQTNYLIQNSASGFEGLKREPGNRITTVTRIVSSHPHCVFVQVWRDFSPVSDSARKDIGEQYVGLQPLDPSNDPNHHNPTGWAIVSDGFQADRSEPPDPCASAS